MHRLAYIHHCCLHTIKSGFLSNEIPQRISLKQLKKIPENQKSMHNYTACKDLNILPFCLRSVNITEHPPPILKVVSQMLASGAPL